MQKTEMRKLEDVLRTMTVLQYVAPIIVLAVALFLPRLVDLGRDADFIVYALCFLAFLDFVAVRFFVIPRMRKRLDHLRYEGDTF